MLENLQKTLLPYWFQLQQQTNGNPRLRWMLWGVLYIFLIYFALSLGEWRAGQVQSINQLQRTAAKLDQLKSQTDWPQRWTAEKAVTTQLRQRLWQAATPALAEADLQNYLRNLANSHSGDALRLRLAPTEMVEVGGETLFKVSAEVSVMILPAQINSFIRSMADNPRMLVVERFGYGAERSGQLNLLVVAYFSAIKLEVNDSAEVDVSAEANNVAP
ncbi:hypothetical protein [Cellvibrio sp. UBA7671]|uniref:hypothetical protein n=1 Tax=Cellvibrio sp. UBA7671 TaxID=1946312 RepID=UPI002F359DA1